MTTKKSPVWKQVAAKQEQLRNNSRCAFHPSVGPGVQQSRTEQPGIVGLHVGAAGGLCGVWSYG